MLRFPLFFVCTERESFAARLKQKLGNIRLRLQLPILLLAQHITELCRLQKTINKRERMSRRRRAKVDLMAHNLWCELILIAKTGIFANAGSAVVLFC